MGGRFIFQPVPLLVVGAEIKARAGTDAHVLLLSLHGPRTGLAGKPGHFATDGLAQAVAVLVAKGAQQAEVTHAFLFHAEVAQLVHGRTVVALDIGAAGQ